MENELLIHTIKTHAIGYFSFGVVMNTLIRKITKDVKEKNQRNEISQPTLSAAAETLIQTITIE
jgi:hypothetical protein